MRILICCCLLLFGCIGAEAKELAGVMVQESIVTDAGTKLHLNGSGVRKKFLFDIYVIGLYMQYPANSVEKVVEAPGEKRIFMHFLYKKVEKASLVEAWNDGFSGNTDQETLAKLKDRIDTFNGLFEDVKKNDVVTLDFIPDRGTAVIINSNEKGVVPGKDFNEALLRIWLGDKPVSSGLKEDLLSGS
jgi:hypothetical protein